MLPDAVRMRLLIDQNVPQAVSDVFIARGHDVQFSRVVLQQNSPDPLIAIAAALEGLVVVTNDADFKKYRDLFPVGFRTQARKLTGRIVIGVDPAKAAARVAAVIDLIEMHHAYAAARRIRFMINISPTSINLIDNAPNP
jgi:hypothetical protein